MGWVWGRPEPMTPDPGSPGVVAQNVATVAALEAATLAQRTLAERVADVIARGAGTLGFALGHLVWFAAWIMVNVGLVPRLPRFDPFPFSLLTLVVSLEAIFLTIFVPHQPEPADAAGGSPRASRSPDQSPRRAGIDSDRRPAPAHRRSSGSRAARRVRRRGAGDPDRYPHRRQHARADTAGRVTRRGTGGVSP